MRLSQMAEKMHIIISKGSWDCRERRFRSRMEKIYIKRKRTEKDIFVSEIEKPGVAQDEITLGENEYFVLGDQASSSDDSRMADIGNVKRRKFTGRYGLIRVWAVILDL